MQWRAFLSSGSPVDLPCFWMMSNGRTATDRSKVEIHWASVRQSYVYPLILSGTNTCSAAASATLPNTCSSIAATAVSVKVEQPEHTVLVAAGINS
jgi:hypothetical protein